MAATKSLINKNVKAPTSAIYQFMLSISASDNIDFLTLVTPVCQI